MSELIYYLKEKVDFTSEETNNENKIINEKNESNDNKEENDLGEEDIEDNINEEKIQIKDNNSKMLKEKEIETIMKDIYLLLKLLDKKLKIK